MTKLKDLSTIANDLVNKCALKLNTSIDALEGDFKIVWKQEQGEYLRKFVEYCATKVLKETCSSVGESISNASLNRFTFDIMLAWQMPGSKEEQSHKVDRELVVQDNAFVWFASLFPLCGDVINAKFTFDTLTTATTYRLNFSAYDKFLKEFDRCIRHLQKQDSPIGVKLGDDEFILHVEGTVGSQRVVRHIGGSSCPGKLTLTNYALYFEASGTVSDDTTLKIDLSKNTKQSTEPITTGPSGGMHFDKAVFYQTSEMPEPVALEFPEMTSSTRRDHWFALTKEITLLHQFLSRYNLAASEEGCEMQSRTTLAIIRLHAAREMLKIASLVPKSFLIFTFLDEQPTRDNALEELVVSLKRLRSDQPCCASSIFRSFRAARDSVVEKENVKDKMGLKGEDDASKKVVDIVEAREKEEETVVANATTKRVEGGTDSFRVLMEILKPVKSSLSRFQKVLNWEKPAITIFFLVVILLVTFMEWVGLALSACLLWAVIEILIARIRRTKDKYDKVVVCTASDKTSAESIESAQHGVRNANELVQAANIALLKIQSLIVSRVEKHTNKVIMAMVVLAIVLALVPFKFVLMVAVLSLFLATSSSRGLTEWWESIPTVPVEFVDKLPGNPE